jgi:hypothetical protein
VSFDPFRPDDAGDESAQYRPKPVRRSMIIRLGVAFVAVALLVAAAVTAVLVA